MNRHAPLDNVILLNAEKRYPTTNHNNHTMAKKKQPKQKVSALAKVPKTAKGTGRKQSGDATYARAYRAALMDPFAAIALGARVPDMFSAPTVSKHYSQSYSLTTASGAGVGATMVVLPNLYMPCIIPTGSLSTGAVPWVTMDGATVGTQTCVVIPTTNISSQLTNYRIVGYGVRLYTTGAITSTSGRVIVSTSPVSSWVNYKPATIGGQATSSNNATASANNTLLAYGLPAAAGVIATDQLPSMQNCFETSLVALASNPMVVTPKINSPEAFEFRQTSDSAIGFSINNQSSATYVSSGDASYLRVSGHELVCIAVIGAGANTPVLQVEIVYHVEGTPSYSLLSSDTPSIVAAPTTMAEIVAAAARSEPFKMGAEALGNAVLPGLGTFARTIF